MHKSDKISDNKCPICLFPDLSEPSHSAEGYGSFEICPSCGNEFGYQDFNTPWVVLRKKWIDSGFSWWSTFTLRPNFWNPKPEHYDNIIDGPQKFPK